VWGRVDLNELALGEMEAEVGREGEEPGALVALGEERREKEREEADGDGEVGPEGQSSGRVALGMAGGVWRRNWLLSRILGFGLGFLFGRGAAGRAIRHCQSLR
jgi:hypothetical protein